MSAKSNKSIKMTIGQNIRRVREQARWTQAALAEKIGMEPNSLSSVERGNVGISMEKLIKISKVFAVSLDDLILGEREKNDVQDMVDRLERLAPEQLRVAYNVLSDLLDGFSLNSHGE